MALHHARMGKALPHAAARPSGDPERKASSASPSGHLTGIPVLVVCYPQMSDTPLQAMLAAIEQLGVRMDRLEAAQERVVGRLDDLEAGQCRLRTDMMERKDRLQTGLDHLRDGHVVELGSTRIGLRPSAGRQPG